MGLPLPRFDPVSRTVNHETFREVVVGPTEVGWASAKMLLDVYGHFMPTESAGFADAITAPNGARG